VYFPREVIDRDLNTQKKFFVYEHCDIERNILMSSGSGLIIDGRRKKE